MSGMDAQSRRRAGLVGVSLRYGAIWGLAEATLGHLLHAARVPGLPGLLMVPVAVAIMGRLAVRHRRAAAVFFAGAVAASFKLFDLLLPGMDLLSVSRPIQAILLEALAGAACIKLMNMGTFLAFPVEIPGVFNRKNQKRPRLLMERP
jgi:hypothetical protein